MCSKFQRNNDFKLKIEKIDWVINVNWSKSFTVWPSIPDWISGWWCKRGFPKPSPLPMATNHILDTVILFVCI